MCWAGWSPHSIAGRCKNAVSMQELIHWQCMHCQRRMVNVQGWLKWLKHGGGTQRGQEQARKRTWHQESWQNHWREHWWEKQQEYWQRAAHDPFQVYVHSLLQALVAWDQI